MKRRISNILVLLGCFSLASVAATAQEVVHALSGTVNNINLNTKTVTIITDDGSGGTFKDLTKTSQPVEFDKVLRADATAADQFKQKGTRVIVFYFGGGDPRTAVALRNLGAGPFTNSTGTVMKFEGHDHLISIKAESGTIETFKIAPETVAETGIGAVEGFKFEPGKGDRVQVISAQTNGSATALFINSM
jgi:hypothetical protein